MSFNIKKSSKIVDVSADVSSISADVTSLTADVTSVTADVTSVTADVTSVTADVASLESKVDIVSSFPSSIDAGAADPISKLQSKVGVDGSIDSSSLEYRISVPQGNFVQPQLTSVATVSNITGYGFGNDNPLRRYCPKNNTSLPTWQRHFESFNGHSSVRKPSGTLRRFMREAVVDSNTKLWRSNGTDGNICWFNPTTLSQDYSDIIYLAYNPGDKSSNYTSTISSTVDYFVDPQPYTEITLSTSPSVSTDGVKIGEYYFKVNKTCMFAGNKLYLDGDYSSLIQNGETVYSAQYSDEDKQLRSGIVMHFASGKWIDAAKYWEPIETKFALENIDGTPPQAISFWGNIVPLGQHAIVVPDEWNDWYYELDLDLGAYLAANVSNYIYYNIRIPYNAVVDENDHDYWFCFTMPNSPSSYIDVFEKHTVFVDGRENLGGKDSKSQAVADFSNLPATSSYVNFLSAVPNGSINNTTPSNWRRVDSNREYHIRGSYIMGDRYYINYGNPALKQRFFAIAPFVAMTSNTTQRVFGGQATLRAVRLS